MTKRQAVELYATIKDFRSGAMSKEGLTEYILLRLKLKKVFDEFETARQEISEQTRQDDTEAWSKAFEPVMSKWLAEEIEPLETAVLSQSDFIEMVTKNDILGIIVDTLYPILVKQ